MTAIILNLRIYTSCDTVNWSPISTTFVGHAGLNVVNGFNGVGRYVMLSLGTPSNGTDVKVSNLEVSGGVNLALNSATGVSTKFSTSTAGSAAVDGSTSTG